MHGLSIDYAPVTRLEFSTIFDEKPLVYNNNLR